MEIINPIFPFISSPLGFVSKHDGGFWKIHHLSYLKGSLINDHITKKAFILLYTSLQKIFDKVIAVGRHAVLIKQDVKDAFQTIFVARHMQ